MKFGYGIAVLWIALQSVSSSRAYAAALPKETKDKYAEFRDNPQKTWSEIVIRRKNPGDKVDIDFLTIVSKHLANYVKNLPKKVTPDYAKTIIGFAVYYCRMEGNCMVAPALIAFRDKHPQEFEESLRSFAVGPWVEDTDNLRQALDRYADGKPNG